jgi:hypothetical protein
MPFLCQSLLCLLEGYQLKYFLDFTVGKWTVSYLTNSSILLKYGKYVYFNIHNSNIATANFFVISAETARWERERK